MHFNDKLYKMCSFNFNSIYNNKKIELSSHFCTYWKSVCVCLCPFFFFIIFFKTNKWYFMTWKNGRKKNNLMNEMWHKNFIIICFLFPFSYICSAFIAHQFVCLSLFFFFRLLHSFKWAKYLSDFLEYKSTKKSVFFL